MFFFFYFSPDAELPDGGREFRNQTVMQDREFHSQSLPGRQAAFADDARLLFSSIRSVLGEHSRDTPVGDQAPRRCRQTAA
ncbi:MAG: hypothetical protein JXA13_16585 [Anaerolineales bacterium]|nr:hypothetical protein [Anaerolineales bacterium]